MATIRLPDAFQRYTGGQRRVSVSGATVGAVLAGLTAEYPELHTRLFDGEGCLRSHLSVAVGDRIVDRADLEETALSSGDELVVLIGLAGG